MQKFDWDKFRNEKIAVHCKTEEEAKDFCRELHERGTRWFCEDDYLKHMNYDKYKEKMCYYSNGKYSSLEFANGNGYTILEWSYYMQEFTKSDLKDGMVLTLDCGVRRILLCDTGSYAVKEDIEFEMGKPILKIAGISQVIHKIEYGEKTVWEIRTKHMTVEEMRQKLEELTGDEIEVEPSREEMIGKCCVYCGNNDCLCGCILASSGNCNFKKYSNEQLKECYEKVIANRE